MALTAFSSLICLIHCAMPQYMLLKCSNKKVSKTPEYVRSLKINNFRGIFVANFNFVVSKEKMIQISGRKKQNTDFYEEFRTKVFPFHLY